MNLSLAFLLLAGAFGATQAHPGTLKGRTLQGDAKRKLKANHKLRGGAALKDSESTRRLEGDGCPDFYPIDDEDFLRFFANVAPPGSHVSSLGTGRLVDVEGGALQETSYTGDQLDSRGSFPQSVYGCAALCIDPPPPSKEAEPCNPEKEKCFISDAIGSFRRLEGPPPLPVGVSWKEGESEDTSANLCTCYYENPENPVDASPTVRTDGEGDLDVGCTYSFNYNECWEVLPFLTQDLYDELTGTEGRDAAYADVNDFCTALRQWNEAIFARANAMDAEGVEDSKIDDFARKYFLFSTRLQDPDTIRAALAAFFGNAAATSGGFANTRDPDMCPSPTLIGGESGSIGEGEARRRKLLGEGFVGCRPEGWDGGQDYDDDAYCTSDQGQGCYCQNTVAREVPEEGEAYLDANDLFFSRGPLGMSGNVAYYDFYDFFYSQAVGGGLDRRQRRAETTARDFCTHPDDVAEEENLWLSAFYLWTMGSVDDEGALSFGKSAKNFTKDEGGCAADLDRLNLYCKAADILNVTELLSMEGCEGLQDTFVTCACDGTCSSCSSFVQVQCPTSSPTMSPNPIKVEVAFSLNAEACSLAGKDREDFILGVQEELQAKSPEGARAIVKSFCRQLVASNAVETRRLQTSTDSWEVVAEIISEVTCGSPSCTDPQDRAAIEAMVNSISNTLQDAIASGDFATALSLNTNVQSALESTILGCLVAWGTVYGDTATFGSGAPLPTANSNTTNLYYPDWIGNSGTCINDGDQPLYMKLNEDAWLYDTLEGCCARYFPGWNLAKCMNTQGTGLWYVSYKDERCVTDCEEGSGGATCGGIAAPISTELYSDPRDCCEAKLQWINLDFCENESLQNECYGGTGMWYRGSNSELCVRDCNPSTSDTCGGVVEEYWVRLHDSAEECCAAEHSWIDEDLCAARSTGTPTDMFWPDKQEAKCVNDTETPVTDLSTSLYESAEDCCAEINWVSVETCVSDATGIPISTVPGSEKWFFYSRGSEQKCAKLCEGAAPCGGVDPAGVGVNDYFDNLETCCDRLSWVARDECELE